MGTTKTTYTGIDVTNFINAYVDSEQKKADSFQLLDFMRAWSGSEPKMWGPTIIGFGTYHYKYESGHEGDAPLIGFSPRKAEFSLYVYMPSDENQNLLNSLGKYKMGKSCIYIKKLSDIDIMILEKICKETIAYISKQYVVKA